MWIRVGGANLLKANSFAQSDFFSQNVAQRNVLTVP